MRAVLDRSADARQRRPAGQRQLRRPYRNARPAITASATPLIDNTQGNALDTPSPAEWIRIFGGISVRRSRLLSSVWLQRHGVGAPAGGGRRVHTTCGDLSVRVAWSIGLAAWRCGSAGHGMLGWRSWDGCCWRAWICWRAGEVVGPSRMGLSRRVWCPVTAPAFGGHGISGARPAAREAAGRVSVPVRSTHPGRCPPGSAAGAGRLSVVVARRSRVGRTQAGTGVFSPSASPGPVMTHGPASQSPSAMHP